MDSEHLSYSSTFLFILLSFVLVALNAFFVAAEFAIVKVRRSRLEELAGQGIDRARISLLCVDDLDESLSATQLGITLVSLALGWIGEESFFSLLYLLLKEKFEPTTVHWISVVASFSVVTLLHVVLGELVPKSLAIQKAEKVTLFISPPLRIFYKMAKPVILLFTWIANQILALMGLKGEEESALTEAELKIVVDESHEEGVLSENEAQIIHKAFSFSDKRAIDIMLPIEKVAFLSLSKTFQENMEFARQRMYTRFPLTAGDSHTILGIVHMKDVLHYPTEWDSNDVFKKVLREPFYISPDKGQDQLMHSLRRRKIHLAVVRDPSTGKNLGIVTMEDILEELVGDIPDEYGN